MKDQKKDILCLTEPQVRYGAVGLLLLMCLVLVVGYYWGKKKAYEEFLENCRSESFNDKIATTLCSLYDAQDEIPQNSVDAADGDTVPTPNEEVAVPNERKESGQEEAEYFAELIGFGTLQQAKHYASRLQKKQVKAYVIEHKSRTARGKVRTWYQVITAPMQYDMLQTLVDRIKIEDHLQGVSIVEFSPKYKERFERALA